MKYFLKLNTISILYALMVFIPVQLMVNVYRISRLTSWEIGTINIITGVIFLIEVVVGTIMLYFLTKKWLNGRKANFWTIILWLPYFVLFIYIFASLFPITNGGDDPNPASGLLIIGGLIVYPFYILILNFFSMTSDEKTIKTS
ncbi:hypothetical protein GLW05_18845 [Pontibacillus yanchengensis]|uniref:Uncharacterized protein n=1 Tax=Pontibacillus yanchengensis TaxID=462910 RepID=A0A6I5A5V0_9BACI|nr:hypothetical protein [Pontibacillus yanchengensis]MYL35638.1 hypothetical protein [Pontibacillus yanchengensis]